MVILQFEGHSRRKEKIMMDSDMRVDGLVPIPAWAT